MSGTSRDGYDEESSLDDVKSDLISDVESVHTTPESRGSSSAFSSPSLKGIVVVFKRLQIYFVQPI